MEREKLGSRLGFILLSAGCAIGVGNVWRLIPYSLPDDRERRYRNNKRNFRNQCF